jgi:hypothetical protein
MVDTWAHVDACTDPITQADAAQFINKSISTVRRWREQAHLVSYRSDNGRVWVSREAVLRLAGMQAAGHPSSPVQRRGAQPPREQPVSTPSPTPDASLVAHYRDEIERLCARVQWLESLQQQQLSLPSAHQELLARLQDAQRENEQLRAALAEGASQAPPRRLWDRLRHLL